MSSSTHLGRVALEQFVERINQGGMRPLGGPHAYDEAQASGFRQSAVLALFTPTVADRSSPPTAAPEALDMFLVQRSPALRHHPGQIALPGGRLEPGETVIDAALRETHEEIGLAPQHIEVLAPLDPVLVPISGFVVTPILGWTDTPESVTEILPGEVLHTLRVRVSDLLNPAHRATVTIAGHGSAGFELPSGWVWGFTGNLLAHLFTEIGWTRPWSRERVHAMSWDEARGAHLRTD